MLNISNLLISLFKFDILCFVVFVPYCTVLYEVYVNNKLAGKFYSLTSRSSNTSLLERQVHIQFTIEPQFISDFNQSYASNSTIDNNEMLSSQRIDSAAGERMEGSDSIFEQDILRRVHYWENGTAISRTLHVASSLSEWALVWALALLFLSYAHELSHVVLEAPAVRFVHIDGLPEGVSTTPLESCSEPVSAAAGSANRVFRSEEPSMRSSGSFTSGDTGNGPTRLQVFVRSFALDGPLRPPLRASGCESSGVLALNTDPHIN